jgi:prepilin-type N-terminal cleavage/methylation domain-containing protein
MFRKNGQEETDVDKTRRQAGFTLIEMAIVLLIMGILVAIAAPVFFDLGPRTGDAAVDATAAAVQSAHAIAVARHLASPTCAQLFDQMRGLTGTGLSRTIPGRGDAVTHLRCTEVAAGGAAATVRVWNTRATTQRTDAAALVVTL